MLKRSTIQLLRFHFSLFLLPIYLFALSQASDINWLNASIAFIVLHLLVYPSSNGYNSYMDRDETPIGGLEHPLKPTRQLYYATIFLDIAAILLSFLINTTFVLCIVLYILASRAYSYRGIRLKRFPVIGFLTVFIFQGALVYFSVYQAVEGSTTHHFWLTCSIASLLIGSLYPLTQIYQHEADRRDGVITISYLLGKRNTFLFSIFLFSGASVLLYLLFSGQEELDLFMLYLLITLPVVLFFLYWMRQVWLNAQAANFKNSLRMNVIATMCTTTYFIILILLKQIE